MASPRHRSPSRSLLLAHPWSETCASPMRVGASPLDAATLRLQEWFQAIQTAFAWVHQAAHLLAKVRGRTHPAHRPHHDRRRSSSNRPSADPVGVAHSSALKAMLSVVYVESSASPSPLAGLVRAGKRRPARTHQPALRALRVERMPRSDIIADVARTALLRTC